MLLNNDLYFFKISVYQYIENLTNAMYKMCSSTFVIIQMSSLYYYYM